MEYPKFGGFECLLSTTTFIFDTLECFVLKIKLLLLKQNNTTYMQTMKRVSCSSFCYSVRGTCSSIMNPDFHKRCSTVFVTSLTYLLKNISPGHKKRLKIELLVDISAFYSSATCWCQWVAWHDDSANDNSSNADWATFLASPLIERLY